MANLLIQNDTKTIETLGMGTHLREIRESYPIIANKTGFKWFSINNLCVLTSALDETSFRVRRVKLEAHGKINRSKMIRHRPETNFTKQVDITTTF